MKALGEVIRAMRKQRHMTLEQLANAIPDYDASNLSRFERGVNSITIDKLELLAEALGTSIETIYSMRSASDVEAKYNVTPGVLNGKRIPVISWVQAGMWTALADNFQPGQADDWVTPEETMSREAYALRVRGDSMLSPAGLPTFPDGIIIMVEPSVEAKTGDFVVVRWNDEDATFKQLTRESGRYYLTPLNPRYPVVELPSDAVFCGVVKEAQFRLR